MSFIGTFFTPYGCRFLQDRFFFFERMLLDEPRHVQKEARLRWCREANRTSSLLECSHSAGDEERFWWTWRSNLCRQASASGYWSAGSEGITHTAAAAAVVLLLPPDLITHLDELSFWGCTDTPTDSSHPKTSWLPQSHYLPRGFPKKPIRRGFVSFIARTLTEVTYLEKNNSTSDSLIS